MTGHIDGLIRDQLAHADNDVDHTRLAQAMEVAQAALPRDTTGPVKLWRVAANATRSAAPGPQGVIERPLRAAARGPFQRAL